MGAQKNRLIETVLSVPTTYVLVEKPKIFFWYALLTKGLVKGRGVGEFGGFCEKAQQNASWQGRGGGLWVHAYRAAKSGYGKCYTYISLSILK